MFAATAAVLVAPGAAIAAPDELDTTFAEDGSVAIGTGELIGLAQGVATGPDNEVVVGGYSRADGTAANDQFALARFHEDGTPDAAFGTGGLVLQDFSEKFDEIRGVAVQPDGRIVVAGYIHNGSNYDVAVARFTVEGDLDNTFADEGVTTLAWDSWADQAYAVGIQDDGRIVIAGQARVGSTNDFIVARLNTDGTLDPTFDDDGMVNTPLGASNEAARALTFDGSGRILVAGYVTDGVGGDHDVAVVRYLSDGSLDPTFGEGAGWVSYDVGSHNAIARGVQVDDDGRIVLSGYQGLLDASSPTEPGYDVFAMRLLTDGSLDAGFGDNGIGHYSHNELDDVSYATAIGQDGTVVAAGEANESGKMQALLVGFDPATGVVDDDWGDGGILTPAAGDVGGASSFLGATTDGDGRVVAAGYAMVGGAAHLAAVRIGDPLDDQPEPDPDPEPEPELTPDRPADCWGVTTSAGKQSYTDLGWSPVDHPTLARYEVQFRHQGSSTWESRFTANTQLRISGLVPGRSHVYRVRAVTVGGLASSWCSVATTVKGAFLTAPPGGGTLVGDRGDDRLRGNRGNDTLRGGAGNDRLLGAAGNDLLVAGPGGDAMEGGRGHDRLVGGPGRNVMVGGAGNDRITARAGRNIVRGGAGADRINVRNGRGGDRVSCGPGRDRVIADRGDRIARDCEKVTRHRR